jgi:hypothetical protein
VLKQSVDIMMEQIRGLRFKRLELTIAAKQKPKGATLKSTASKDRQVRSRVEAGDVAWAEPCGACNLGGVSSRWTFLAARAGDSLFHGVESFDRARRTEAAVLADRAACCDRLRSVWTDYSAASRRSAL